MPRPILKLGRLLIECSVVLFEYRLDLLFGVAPSLHKRPQIFPRTAPKNSQHLIRSRLLIPDRISIDRLLLAPAPLFPDYVVQIVVSFHGIYIRLGESANW